MLWILLFFSAFRCIQSSCPDGFELVRNGQCRLLKAIHSDIPNGWVGDLATQKCREINAQPVIIHDQIDQWYWTGRESKDTNVLLGLTCNGSKGWEWADGTTVDFKPTSPSWHDLALNGGCSQPGCGWILHGYEGYWIYDCSIQPSGSSMFGDSIFCTTQLPPLPAPSDDDCEKINDNGDEACYEIGGIAGNWQEAQLICRQLGANLASIHNEQENTFIRRLAVSKGAVNGLVLGATAKDGENYTWTDGFKWDYDNFAQGYPNTGLGDCIAMNTSSSSGQWINVDCSDKLPVACIRDQTTVVDQICSEEDCKDEGVIIHFLEANTCCDKLIVYDGPFPGDILATLTGEMGNVTFTNTWRGVSGMRVSWQPNGGVNVRGFAMSFRGV